MREMRRVLVAAAAIVVAACSGPPGKDGQDGQPCTVKNNNDGTATITCPDGSSVTVANGTDGTNGLNGTNGTNGTNGMDGTSCSVADGPDAGLKTISCTDGTSVIVSDGRNGVDANTFTDYSLMTAFELQQTDFAVTIQSVSNDPKPVVQFTVRDAKGRGVTKIPPNYFSGIALLQLVPGNPTTGGNGVALDTWISHIANCATCTSSTETANATTLVDHGNGTYTYTFQKDVVNPTAYDGGMAVAGVAFDANAVHRFAMRLSVSGNAFRPVDVTYDYIPATGANVDGQNDKVNTDNCLTCHNQWRAGPLNIGGATPFHGGTRYDVRYCVVCHNDQRKFAGNNIAGNAVIAEPTIDSQGNMTPPPGRTNIAVLRGEAIINLPVFVHKIHAGEHLSLKGNYAGLGTEINEFMFPQDVRNCTKCHSNAARADNWKSKPSRRACGACHDNVNFATGQGHSPSNLAQPNDNSCTMCHNADFIAAKHLAVAPPDPNNAYAGGTNNNTNASYIANVNNPPPGVRLFQYDLKSVTAVAAGDGGVNPQVVFRFVENDAGVVFNTYDGGANSNLLDNFVGAPSVYCAWAMPQDGIAEPADFNASASAYLRNVWATGTGGTMTGPDSTGYYTVKLTTTLPPTAKMLTCGIGYTYSLSSTQPFTQTDVPGYPYNANKTGGISAPPRNVWRVATGYTGRRGASNSGSTTGQIAQANKCNACHNELGVSPTYHAGQRNDAATCSFCHTPNRTSSGWTAGSTSFVHAIHAATRRTVPYNWHAVAETTSEGTSVRGFFGVEYPGRLNYCETCHTPGYYDFSASWYTSNGGANMDKRLMQTVGQGTYDAVTPTSDGGVPSLFYSVSPYVDSTGATNYGAGYSYNAGTQVITNAAATTLVISPIATTCFGCHDSDAAKLHMENNGATIYGPRSAAANNVEQCMICHGPGRSAAIKDVHYNR
ncbi:MAG: OmcA/MtrC family decaheme c-type cytochrome [Myxococcota bacterium]